MHRRTTSGLSSVKGVHRWTVHDSDEQQPSEAILHDSDRLSSQARSFSGRHTDETRNIPLRELNRPETRSERLSATYDTFDTAHSKRHPRPSSAFSIVSADFDRSQEHALEGTESTRNSRRTHLDVLLFTLTIAYIGYVLQPSQPSPMRLRQVNDLLASIVLATSTAALAHHRHSSQPSASSPCSLIDGHPLDQTDCLRRTLIRCIRSIPTFVSFVLLYASSEEARKTAGGPAGLFALLFGLMGSLNSESQISRAKLSSIGIAWILPRLFTSYWAAMLLLHCLGKPHPARFFCFITALSLLAFCVPEWRYYSAALLGILASVLPQTQMSLTIHLVVMACSIAIAASAIVLVSSQSNAATEVQALHHLMAPFFVYTSALLARLFNKRTIPFPLHRLTWPLILLLPILRPLIKSQAVFCAVLFPASIAWALLFQSPVNILAEKSWQRVLQDHEQFLPFRELLKREYDWRR